MFDSGKKTGANLTIRGKTNPGASAAEWLGDGSDDADLTGGAVSEAIARRRFRSPGNFERRKRKSFFDARANLAAGHDVLTRPIVSRIKRHEFDEAHLYVVCA